MDLKITIHVNERLWDYQKKIEVFKSKVVYDLMHFIAFYFSCSPFLENKLQGLSLWKNVSFTLLALWLKCLMWLNYLFEMTFKEGKFCPFCPFQNWYVPYVPYD